MSTPEPSRLPFRAMAMVLLAMAILFGGLGWNSLVSRDGETLESAEAASSTKPSTSSAIPAPPVTSTFTVKSTVQVYNNSTVTGLAAATAQKITQAGWTVSDTGNYKETNVSVTTVYYGSASGERESALQIAEKLGVKAEPRFAELLTKPAGVIVIVTSN
ncbi:MAG: LytR C-terminal domain-containing protein [Mycobacteriaceae bacterium]